MRKEALVSFLFIILILSFPLKAFASSNLEVSSNSNFSSQSLNYDSNQTVYVRLNTDISGAQTHTLNLRDNLYNLITSYNLNNNGNQYSTNFQAPSGEGYYSLEARVESDGSLTTSVKTIKVGKPQNSNVNVSIHNNVSGQNVLGSNTNNNSKSANEGSAAKESDDKAAVYQSQVESKSDISENQDITYSQNSSSVPQKKSIIFNIKTFCTEIINIIWPF